MWKIFLILFCFGVIVKLCLIRLIIGVMVKFVMVLCVGKIFRICIVFFGNLIFLWVLCRVVVVIFVLYFFCLLFGKVIWFGWCFKWFVCLVSRIWVMLLIICIGIKIFVRCSLCFLGNMILGFRLKLDEFVDFCVKVVSKGVRGLFIVLLFCGFFWFWVW